MPIRNAPVIDTQKGIEDPEDQHGPCEQFRTPNSTVLGGPDGVQSPGFLLELEEKSGAPNSDNPGPPKTVDFRLRNCSHDLFDPLGPLHPFEY